MEIYGVLYRILKNILILHTYRIYLSFVHVQAGDWCRCIYCFLQKVYRSNIYVQLVTPFCNLKHVDHLIHRLFYINRLYDLKPENTFIYRLQVIQIDCTYHNHIHFPKIFPTFTSIFTLQIGLKTNPSIFLQK